MHNHYLYSQVLVPAISKEYKKQVLPAPIKMLFRPQAFRRVGNRRFNGLKTYCK